jgi:hypothetical protein
MKTQKEIEQLAEKYYPPYPDGTITDEIRVLREGFIKGYSCQEDMTDKKPVTKEIVDYAMKITSKDVRAPKCVRDGIVKRMYTEKDIIDAVIFGMRKGLFVGLEAETDCDWVNNYVKSLNKQD